MSQMKNGSRTKSFMIFFAVACAMFAVLSSAGAAPGGKKTGIAGRGIEGLMDSLMKVFGI